ncbi:MAG: hypothetical protein IPL00_19285 [Gammaproteobacteria bacterium]|nr:hypothetical protein [Gammaproteobacteria bacterium]
MSKPKTAIRKTVQRRTQEERKRDDTEKVINATIDCIVEEGLHNATAARIATQHSSVTWGRDSPSVRRQKGFEVLLAVIRTQCRGLSQLSRKRTGTRRTHVAGADAPTIDVTWKYINEPCTLAFNELGIYNA